jgi:hypothetical protein
MNGIAWTAGATLRALDPLAERLQPHVPTSVVLAQLLEDVPRDQVSLAWLLGRLQRVYDSHKSP